MKSNQIKSNLFIAEERTITNITIETKERQSATSYPQKLTQ